MGVIPGRTSDVSVGDARTDIDLLYLLLTLL